MTEKILYITDLDGTLLRNDATVSDFTKDTLNSMMKSGMIFSYATARAYATASKVTAGIDINVPVVVYNGTFIVDGATGERISGKFFRKDESEYILDVLRQHDISPITYADIDGRERYSYNLAGQNVPGTVFVKQRSGDSRENITTSDRLGDGRLFHFTCFGDKNNLAAARDRLAPLFHTDLYLERYTQGMCLEIHPVGASKAEAVVELKGILGCDRVVSFGDGGNDIPMFRISDEGYAMENAVPELKKIATGVIGVNDNDGVARWILENTK